MAIEKPFLLKAIAGTGLLLMFIPSVVLLKVAGRYFSFLGTWEKAPLTPSHTTGIPHRPGGRQPSLIGVKRRIRFMKFKFEAAKAQEVTLVGDFNLWDNKGTPLKKEGGAWETVIPLPPGRYHYLFKVDGQWKGDPGSAESGRRGPLKTSILDVQP